MSRRWIPLLLLACLGASSVVAQQRNDPRDESPEVQAGRKLPDLELTPQIFYQLLLAEIAGGRGNLGLATEAYRDLARTTRDPRIAERAAQIALYARRYEAALDAARLWAELDPESAQARQMVTTLMAASKSPDDLAQHIARQLAKEDVNLPNALLQLNRALARISDKRQVLRIVDRVTTPYLGMAEAHFARAVAAFGARDNARALAETEQTLKLRPDWEQPTLLRAQILPRGQAIEALQKFSQEHEGSRDLRLMLARLYFGEKRYAEARKTFRELLGEAPDDVDNLYAVGVLSYQLGDLAEAERLFRRLIEVGFADGNSVRLYLGQIAEDGKRWGEALKWYGEIKEGEQYLSARLRQAGVLARQGDLDAGLLHLREARAGHESSKDGDNAIKLLIGEAELLREAGRGKDAQALLETELAKQPDRPELLYESALLAERLGRLDLFDVRIKRLLQVKPEHAHAYNALGYSLLERKGDLDEAERLIDKALSLAPDDPFILDSKGWLLFRRGDNAGAVEILQRAFTLRADPEIAAHLGEVLWTLDRKDEATRIWRDAAKASPTNEALSATMKRLLP